MKTRKHSVCLGLGSNIESEKNLVLAVEYIRTYLELKSASAAWETPAVGTDGPDFLNAAVLIDTHLSAVDLKTRVIQKIEQKLGRVRTQNKYAPRTIDIDILIFDNQILEPLIWKHAYLAVPVAELLPDIQSEELGINLKAMARQLLKSTHITPRYDVRLYSSLNINEPKP